MFSIFRKFQNDANVSFVILKVYKNLWKMSPLNRIKNKGVLSTLERFIREMNLLEVVYIMSGRICLELQMLFLDVLEMSTGNQYCGIRRDPLHTYVAQKATTRD